VDAEDDDTYLDRLADTRPLQLQAIAARRRPRPLAQKPERRRPRARAGQLQRRRRRGGPHHRCPRRHQRRRPLEPDDDGAADRGAGDHPDEPDDPYRRPDLYDDHRRVHRDRRAGYSAADVETRAEQAVLDFLSRAQWGLPPTGDQRLWLETTTVRFQDVSTVLNNTAGFDHWTASRSTAAPLTW
jgi:hypothetical protein